MTCRHESIRDAGPTEECRDCGARRRWNINGTNAEVSPWAKRVEGET